MNMQALSTLPPGINSGSHSPKAFGKSSQTDQHKNQRVDVYFFWLLINSCKAKWPKKKLTLCSLWALKWVIILTALSVDEHQLTGRDFKTSPHTIGSYHKREPSQTKQEVIAKNDYSLSKSGFNNKQPTSTLGMAGAQQMLQTNMSVRSQQPYSFKASID